MTGSTIPVIVALPITAEGTKGLTQKVAGVVQRVVEVDAETLKANLSVLISRVGKMIDVAEESAGALTLKEVEIGVEITAEGGVQLIGTTSVGATASISLTFTRK